MEKDKLQNKQVSQNPASYDTQSLLKTNRTYFDNAITSIVTKQQHQASTPKK